MSTPYIMVLGIGVGSLILAWLCGYWKKNSRKASQRRTFACAPDKSHHPQ